MLGQRRINPSPIFIVCVFITILMVFGAFACNAPGSETTLAEEPEALPPAEVEQDVVEPEVEQPEAPSPDAGIDEAIIGFWKAKVVGKQEMVFEFQADGSTTWHYRYNNGQKKDNAGTYRVEDHTVIVDMDGEQELAAEYGDMILTLTGPDGKPLSFQKIAGLDSPSPTASTNIAQDIVGKWQDPATEEWIEFKADGTVSITSPGHTLNGTYSAGTMLEMKLEGQDQSSRFDVVIDDGVLTLYAQDSSFTDYVK